MKIKDLEKEDIFEGAQVAVNHNGDWVLGVIIATSLDKVFIEVEFEGGEAYGEYYGQEDIDEYGLKAVVNESKSLLIETIGTDGHQPYVIINGEKVEINRKQYFRLMYLSEDNQDLTLEDASDFNMQMVTGIPAF